MLLSLICSANSLRDKFINATASSRVHDEAFQEIDDNVPIETRMKWTAAMRRAQADRVDDPTAMDVYDVQMEKGENVPLYSRHPSNNAAM